MAKPIYALDFDGVLCDSALETAVSGWQASRSLWPEMPASLPANLMTDFRQIRPLLETGFEAILICRGLYLGLSVESFQQGFADCMAKLMSQEKCSPERLKSIFAAYRDNWISTNLAGWIEMNPLYQGVQSFLKSLPVDQCFIVTTKQERFVHAILEANSISLPAQHVFGMDRQLKKPQILSYLQQTLPNQQLFFIEDRLPTLMNVLDTEALQTVQLGFAGWGYNTDEDKQIAQQHTAIAYLAAPSDLKRK